MSMSRQSPSRHVIVNGATYTIITRTTSGVYWIKKKPETTEATSGVHWGIYGGEPDLHFDLYRQNKGPWAHVQVVDSRVTRAVVGPTGASFDIGEYSDSE